MWKYSNKYNYYLKIMAFYISFVHCFFLLSWGGINVFRKLIVFSKVEKSNVHLTDGLNYMSFEKGLGTHADLTIIYDISGKNYDYFEAYIGLDTETGESSDGAIFKVLADNKEIYKVGL